MTVARRSRCLAPTANPATCSMSRSRSSGQTVNPRTPAAMAARRAAIDSRLGIGVHGGGAQGGDRLAARDRDAWRRRADRTREPRLGDHEVRLELGDGVDDLSLAV